MQKYKHFLYLRKIFYISIHFCRIYYNIADENGRRDAAVDVAVLFVGLLLIGGESCITGGIGGFDDGIEVKRDGLVGLVAEVGKVEGDACCSSLNTGHELADIHLILNSIDEDQIIGIGVGGIAAGIELEIHMQAVNATTGKLHTGHQTSREQQTGIVDMDHAIVVGEALFVDAGELVVLDMAVAMGFLSETTLDGGAEDRRGVLHSLEERTLPKLRLRLVVGERFGLASAEQFAKTFIEDAVINGAGHFNQGWFYLCHSILVTKERAFYYKGT